MSEREDGRGTKPRRLLTQPLAIVLLVIAAVSGVTAVVMPIRQLTQDSASATIDVSREASQLALNRVPNLPANTSLSPTSNGGLTVTVSATPGPDGQPVPLMLRFLTNLGTALWAAAVAVMAFLLALIVSTISSGTPFHRKNSTRLVWISIAILVGSVGADTLNWISANMLYDYLQLSAPLEVVPYYSIPPFLMAALVLVLASAFRSGRQISDDVEGLV